MSFFFFCLLLFFEGDITQLQLYLLQSLLLLNLLVSQQESQLELLLELTSLLLCLQVLLEQLCLLEQLMKHLPSCCWRIHY